MLAWVGLSLVLMVVDASRLRGKIRKILVLEKGSVLGVDEKLVFPIYANKADVPSWLELGEGAQTWQEVEKLSEAAIKVLGGGPIQAVPGESTIHRAVRDAISLRSGVCFWYMALLSSMLYAVVGLGHSLLFHGLYILLSSVGALGGDIREAVLYICMMSPAAQIMQLFNLWFVGNANTKENPNRSLMALFTISLQVGLLPGLYMMSSDRTPTVVLQVILVLAMTATLAAQRFEASKPASTSATRNAFLSDMRILGPMLTVVLCGLGAGFCQGAIGAGGAAKMIMILSLRLSNKEWRRIACVADTPLQIVRFTLLTITGQINIAQRWVEILALWVAVFIGLSFGNMLAPRVSSQNYNSFVMCLICVCIGQLCTNLFWKVTFQERFSVIALVSLLLCAAGFTLLVGLTVAVRGKLGTLFTSVRWYYIWVQTKKSPNFVHGIGDVLRVILGAATIWLRPPPSVWIIGEKKTGTTSLHYYLTQHPNIVEPLAKETHFFSGRNVFGPELSKDVDLIRSFYPTMFYHFVKRLFSPYGFFQPVLGIESTPWNMMLPWAADGIEQLAAARPAKVIVTLREPIDRLQSDYWFEVARQDEARSIEDAIKAETTEDAWFWEHSWPSIVADRSLRRMLTDRRDAGKDPFGAKSFRHPPLFAYERRGHYIEHLRPWIKRFGPENVLLIAFDDLTKDPIGTTNMVCKWVGLPEPFDLDCSPQNVNMSNMKKDMAPATRLMLEQRFAPTLAALMRETNFLMAETWLRSYKRNLWPGPDRSPDSCSNVIDMTQQMDDDETTRTGRSSEHP